MCSLYLMFMILQGDIVLVTIMAHLSIKSCFHCMTILFFILFIAVLNIVEILDIKQIYLDSTATFSDLIDESL